MSVHGMGCCAAEHDCKPACNKPGCNKIDRAFLLQAGYDGAVLFAPALDFPR